LGLSKILKGFKRVNEAVSPELLEDDELAILEDAVLDEEFGRPKKRFGWARFNANQADTVGNISSLHEVITSDDSNYLLVGIDGELKKSLNGTAAFTVVTDKGTPPYKMQPYADEFIFTEGSVAPFLVSGATLGTVTDLEITKPDVVLGNDATNGVQTGENNDTGDDLTTSALYKWIIVYATDDGTVSPPSYPIGAWLTQGRAGFQNLPVSADARVTRRFIYRTKANEDTFYFHSEINNTITTWFDEAADSELGSENFDYLNLPATAEYLAIHKERLFTANLTKTVKGWFTPCYSKGAAFNVTFEGATYAFTAILGNQNCVAATVVGGTLASGDYTYRFVFYDENGIMSDPIDTNTVTIPAAANQMALVYIYPTVEEGFYITKADIYRDKDGGGFELFYTSNPQFDYATIPFFYDTGAMTPTTAYSSNQTTDTEKSSVAFSEIGTPATFRLEDVRNVYPDDGDEITGIYDDIDGLIVFKKRSICKIFTNGAPDNWKLVRLLTNIGCDEPNSLLKHGNDYIFSHQKEIYKFNSQGGYEKIGTFIKDTLALVTAYHSATAHNKWYIIGVTSTAFTSGYGFLIYDHTQKTWYRFNTTTIPYVAAIKEHGNSAGVILTSNATYILNYGTGAADADTGSNVDIVPIIRTKTFGDGVALERLRRTRFNYKKVDDETLTITVVNPDTVVENTHTDTTNSANASDFKIFEEPVGDSDSLKIAPKFYINVTGAGFEEWGVFKLESYPVRRGKRDVVRQ
jgi:hypothetical protein